VCYGTRPQVIKASRLIPALRGQWDLLTVDTGQHYDYELNALLYKQLDVTEPDICLEIGSGDHAGQTSAILTRVTGVLSRHMPWAVVVIGDTNSTLGSALAAAKLRIPVVHVEAGLRSNDLRMAEEVNRRVVDAISSVLCTPSALGERNLHDEHPLGMVARTGDIARDVLEWAAKDAGPPGTPPLAAEPPYAFATLHRAELTDDPDALRDVVRALGELPGSVIFAVHPRTRAALERIGLIGSIPPSVRVSPPLGYLETIRCVRQADVVITDSGGLQREAYWLGTPCVTVRRETEWVETVDLGANTLVAPGRAAADLSDAVTRQRERGRRSKGWNRDAYGAGNAADLIRAAIERWGSGG
jgi:UDP-GlcNAc3NAcA epimerase